MSLLGHGTGGVTSREAAPEEMSLGSKNQESQKRRPTVTAVTVGRH